MSEQSYLDHMERLLVSGVHREGRNGGTRALFGAQMRHDLSAGFPLLTTKKVHFHSVVVEQLWFLRGDTNVDYLHQHGVTIWDEWADDFGDLGPVYGKQWRAWTVNEEYQTFTDQIAEVINALIEDPYSRRHVVSAWNVSDLRYQAIPPCHCLFQFHVAEGRLSCHLYQRSADWFLGVPFNIASYALLTHLIAREVGLEVGEFIHSFGDYHLYENHKHQARQQLDRAIRPMPRLLIESDRGIFDLVPSDIHLIGYDPHPAIKAPVSK